MISYYIQPGHQCWLVMRDDEAMARTSSACLALQFAKMFASRSARHGEQAVFTGIATEPLKSLRQAA